MDRREFLGLVAAISAGSYVGCNEAVPHRPIPERGARLGKRRIVCISDTHIGIDAPTNWYQRKLHEPMLLAMFEHVIANAAQIAELVLLGDIVDQWTYLPTVRPPSFAEIAAANPNIFAPKTGAIARAIEALEGAVTIVAGNHDMQLDEAQASMLRDRTGRTIRYTNAFPYLPAAGLDQVACAHGHQFSVFNAPDPFAKLPANLPLGHFITRLTALWTSQHLPAGKTAADLAESGDPTGWTWKKDELFTLLADVFEGKNSLAQLVMDALIDATGADVSLPITLFDGTSVTIADARDRLFSTVYRGFEDPSRYPGSAYGTNAAVHALISTDIHNDLSHFAGELGKRHRVVVFGHTHEDRERLLRPDHAPTVYANSGFGCPSVPNMARAQDPQRATFVDVDVDREIGEVMVLLHAVEPDLQIATIPSRTQVLKWHEPPHP